jgi:integrase
MYPAAMPSTPSGHIEQLPSGSWRSKVYAGTDPLTGREICFRKSRRSEVEAQIELGKLLELSPRRADSDVTVAELLDEYVPLAGWDLSTEEANLGYIRRTIKPNASSCCPSACSIRRSTPAGCSRLLRASAIA